jgi:hypothetical protein
MQDGMFLQFLYRCLLRLSKSNSEVQQHVTIPALEAVSAAFLRRKTPLTWMLTAFVKRVLTVSLSLPVNGTLACMALVRQLAAVHSEIAPLFNDCEGDVSAAGVYLHDGSSLDSSTANGTGTVAWELRGLARHYHPHVQSSVRDLLKQRPLPADVTPASEFKAYDASSGKFTPAVAAPSKQPLIARAAAALTAQRKHLIAQAAADAEKTVPTGATTVPGSQIGVPDGVGDDLDPLAWLECAGAGRYWQLSGAIDVLSAAAAAESHDAVIPSVADLTPHLKSTMVAVRARKEAVKKGHFPGDPLASDATPGGALLRQLARADRLSASLRMAFSVTAAPVQELYEDAKPLSAHIGGSTAPAGAGAEHASGSSGAAGDGAAAGAAAASDVLPKRRGGKKKRQRGE